MPATLRHLRIQSTVLVLVFAAVACAGDPATAPPPALSHAGVPSATRDMPHMPNGNAFGRVAKCTHRESRKGTAVIGPKGGKMRVGDDYLIVPAGALETRVKISGEVPDGDAADIRLEPHGLRFALAATLIIDATGCDIGGSDDPVLLYLGDDGTVLERIEARYDPGWARLAAPITHFSVYAVGV